MCSLWNHDANYKYCGVSVVAGRVEKCGKLVVTLFRDYCGEEKNKGRT